MEFWWASGILTDVGRDKRSTHVNGVFLEAGQL